MEVDLNGRQPQWKTTSRKPYRNQMTLACLSSQFYTELGPAQPQLVISLFLKHHAGCKGVENVDLQKYSKGHLNPSVSECHGGSNMKYTNEKEGNSPELH